jgi:hypothetical protein
MMKIILVVTLFILPCFLFSQVANAQSNNQVPQSLDSLGTKVMKLMEFYESYDNGSPESLKKANYKNAVKEITEGTASQKEIDKSYKIVDWYIKGDKAIGDNNKNPNPDKESLDEYLENTDEAKAAINYLNQQKSMLQKMSYSEFEDFIEKASPLANKSDIKKAYNEMHKSDGKQVAISSSDDEMTETQKQVWALDILNNPKNYEEFRKAFKILSSDITDSEIRKGWDKRDK